MNTSLVYDDIPIIFAGHVLLGFYCIIFIFGFLGNLAVIYVGIRKKKYRNVTNCYVINLALADLLFLTVSIPYTTYIGLVDTHPFGETFCKLYMYLAYVFLLATCNTLSAMSVDRYLYIVLPKSKLIWRTPSNAILICIFIWLGSLALLIPYHFLITKLEICQAVNSQNFVVCFLIFCSYYAIPLLIIIVCYTKLAMHVIQSHRLVLSQMNTRNLSKLLATKQRRITRMVIVVTLAFALCWLPIHVLELMKCANASILLNLLQTHPKFLYAIRAFAHALAYFNSCLNPYLYALLNRNFCFDLIGIFPTCCNSCGQTELLRPPMTRILSTSTAHDEVLIQKKTFSHDEEEDEEYDNNGNYKILFQNRTHIPSVDVGCQVNLLRTRCENSSSCS